MGFSRSPGSCPLGKLTAQLPAVRVPEETLELLTAKSRKAGCSSLVEYLRLRAMIDAHGFDAVHRMHEDRLKVVAGMMDVSLEKDS